MSRIGLSRVAVLCSGVFLGLSDAHGQRLYWTSPSNHVVMQADLDGSNVQRLAERRVFSSSTIAIDDEANQVYWPRHNSIYRVSPDAARIELVVEFIPQLAIDLALDLQHRYIYWLAGGGGQSKRILRTSLKGGGIEEVITDGLDDVTQIALDGHGSGIYWIDSARPAIRRARLDGSSVEDVVALGLWEPAGIAVDSAAGKMYWTDAGSVTIWRANLDGSDRELVLAGSIGNDRPGDLHIDSAAGRLYWINKGVWIQTARLDGTDQRLVQEREVLALALDSARGKLYWSSGVSIHRSDVNGSNTADLFAGDPRSPTGLAIDLDGGKIYWRGHKIGRANLDGSSVEHLLTLYPNPGSFPAGGLALDPQGGRMYWVDQDGEKIRRANLDGSDVEDFLTELGRAVDLAIDPIGGHVYWTQLMERYPAISRANLDGSNQEALVGRPVTAMHIALDLSAGKMYWTDNAAQAVRRANLDGSSVADVLVGLPTPSAVAVDSLAGRLYWEDGHGVHCSTMDGTQIEHLLSGLGAWDLVLDPRECSGHGQRVGDTCICAAGWSGADCSCSAASCPRDCSGAGSCVCGECACDPDFSGADCACRIACPGECSGHGACTCAGCACDPGWTGADCGCPAACPGDCSGHGECSCGVCSCDRGWEGEDCSCPSSKCTAKCSGHGRCECDECICDPGWTGGDCTIVEVGRVFMSLDGLQGDAPRTGSTTLFLEPGGSARIGVFLEDTRVPGQLLSAVQLIVPNTAVAYPGSAGQISYVNDDGGPDGGNSILVDQERTDWVFHGLPLDPPQIYYHESDGAFGAAYFALAGHKVNPSALHYLAEFELQASADAGGSFILPLRVVPGEPPVTNLFLPYGSVFGVSEYQTMTIQLNAPQPAASEPPDGAIDATDPSGASVFGWDQVAVQFDGPVIAAGPEDFEVDSSGGVAPRIESIISSFDRLTIVLDQPIPAGACTTLRHLSSGWTTRLGALPGDASGDGVSGPLDILALVDHLDGAGSSLESWQCDINRSGLCEPSDILRLIDLLNGAGTHEPWNGRTLPECP